MKYYSIIYFNCCETITDGGTGYGVFSEDSEVMIKVQDCWSNFSAEAEAVLTAVRLTASFNPEEFVICTDSLSVLHAIKNPRNKNTIVQNMQFHLVNAAKSILLIWIPSHVGLIGNEKADLLAKAASEKQTIDTFLTPYEDILKMVTLSIQAEMRSRWRESTTFLSSIKDSPEPWPLVSSLGRRESTIICRLRIGHTNLTHIYRILRADPPRCEECQCQLTVQHILVDCRKYNNLRRRLNMSSNIKELLSDNASCLESTLKFIRLANLYSKI